MAYVGGVRAAALRSFFDRLRINDLLEGASLDQLPRSARAACATDRRSSRAEALAEESTRAYGVSNPNAGK